MFIRILLLIAMVAGFEGSGLATALAQTKPGPNQSVAPKPNAERPEGLRSSSDSYLARGGADAAKESERAERDLIAQEAMASWAFWLLVTSIVSVALTLAGLVMIWRTLFHTRKAAEASAEMVSQAQRATGAAAHQAKIAEAALVANERPWISADTTILGFRFVQDGDGFVQASIDIEFVMKNFGKSPAIQTIAYVKTRATTFSGFADLRSEFDYAFKGRSESPAKLGHIVVPQGEVRQRMSLIISPGEIGKALKNHPFPCGRSIIAPDLLACVVYVSPTTGKTYETGFVQHIRRHHSATSDGNCFHVELGEVPTDQLTLQHAIVGGYVT